MSKSKLKPIDEVPFTNSKGHVLNPGDPAIALTMSTSSAGLRVGRYLGVRKGPSWGGREYLNVVMSVNKSTSKLVHKETGVEFDNKFYKENPYPQYPSHNSYNRAEFDSSRKKYNEEISIRNAKENKAKEDYEWKEFPYVGRTTLQLNKIYPADIALKDVAL